MHFKSLSTCFLSFVILFLVVGCQIKTNEQPPQPKLNETFVTRDTKCLVSASAEVSLFIQGKGDIDKVNQVWDCAMNAVELFKKSTQGSIEDKFKPRELANFFEKYFLSNDEKVTEELLEETFYIKKLFLGGTSDFITRKELDQMVRFIQLVKEVSKDLNLYIKVYREDWQPINGATQANVDFFNNSMQALQKSIEKIGLFISIQNESYDLNRLPRLVVEMDKLFKWNWKWSSKLEEILPIIFKTKKVLYGGQADLISSREWSSIHNLIIKGLNIYLRYRYFIKDINLIKPGSSLEYLYESSQDFIRYFSEVIKYKSSKQITLDEAYELTDAYTILYNQIRPSKDFFRELFYIKSVFLGGDDQSLKLVETEQLITDDNSFYHLYQSFLNHIDVYTIKWKISGNSDEDKLKLASAKNSLIAISDFIAKKTKYSYDLNRLTVFLKALESFYPSLFDSESLSIFVNNYKDLIYLTRDLTHESIATQDSALVTNWNSFFQVFSKGYNLFLDYQYNFKISESTFFEKVNEEVINNFFSFGQWIINKQSGQLITDKLILKYSKIIPLLVPNFKSVGQNSISKAIPALLNQVLLDPVSRFNNNKPNVFDLRHLNYLQSIVLRYFRFKNVIEDLYFSQTTYSVNNLRQYLQTKFPEYHKELVFIFSERFSLRCQQGLINYDVGNSIEYSKQEASCANLGFFMSQILFNSIPAELKRVQNFTGFNESEFSSFYSSFRSILVDLKFVDKDDLDFSRKRFYEAMLLTGEADGNSYINFKETNDYVLTLLSGLYRQKFISRTLSQSCFLDGMKAQRDCAIKSVVRNFDFSFSSMSGYKRYFNSLDYSSQRVFISKHFEAAGASTGEPNLLSVSIVEKVPHVAQYVETVMKRFDKNEDGVLDTVESMSSYPLFKEVLMKFSGQTSDSRLRGLLSWLLTHDKPPETILEKAAFFLWCLQSEDSWNVRADRYQIVNVLSIVANYKN